MNAIAEPGLRVVWPKCRDDMHALVRRLLDSGADEDVIMGTLLDDFPGLLYDTDPAWRRDAVYRNVIAMNQMAALRRGRPQPVFAPSGNGTGAMSPGLVAFAEARGLVCAYCGRAGGRGGDPDGLAWNRDSVPRGFQIAGRDLELSCSACKTDPERHHRLGGDNDAT